MALDSKIQISVGANLSATTKNDLQKELNRISGELKFKVDGKQSKNAISQIHKNYTKSIGSLNTANKRFFESFNNLSKKSAKDSANVFRDNFNKIGSAVGTSTIAKDISKISTLSNKSAKDSASAFNESFKNIGTVIKKSSVTDAISNINYLSKKSAKESANVFAERFNNIGTSLKKSSINDAILNISKTSNKSAEDSAKSFINAFNKVESNAKIATGKNKAFTSWFSGTQTRNLPTQQTSAFNLTPQDTKSNNQAFDSWFIPKSSTENINSAKASMSAFNNALKEGVIVRDRYGKVNREATKEFRIQNKEMINATKNQFAFSNMLMTGIKKMMIWSITATALFAPLRAFQNGLQTLKEIDTQLVDIAKVTNLTAKEMEELAKRASEVGVELGRTTQEYLQAVTEFSRAGYNDQAEDLAKLSLLLQNVGDVTSETANEMLIAVDAAYGLNGSATELTKVIDSLNAISNNNPTSIGKMADGIKVAASVFKLAGLSINEFTALVGTGTSATQQSGDVVARALRTVLMNIQGVTDSVGETTEETISKSDEVLKKYGISIRDTITNFINPMEVFSQISEKFQTTLKGNEVAQSEIISTLAGKRQANFLAGIIDNWDMVQKQIYEAMYATGSAMRENEIYMQSWEAKSKQLSSAVAEFWVKSLDTDLIKGFIDILRKGVETLTDFGGLIPIIAGLLIGGLVGGILAVRGAVKVLNIELVKTAVLSGGWSLLIGGLVTLLTALGYKYIWASDKIHTFNTSIGDSIEKETELLKSENDRVTTLETMASRYEELSKKQALSKEESIELETITNTLSTLYPTLKIGVTETTDAYDAQITKLKELTLAERESLKEKALLAQANAKAQLALVSDAELEVENKYNSAMSTRNNALKGAGSFDPTSVYYNPEMASDLDKAGKSTYNAIGSNYSSDLTKEQKEFINKYKSIFAGIGITEDQLNLATRSGETGIKNLLKKANELAQDNIIKYEPQLESIRNIRKQIESSQIIIDEVAGLSDIKTETDEEKAIRLAKEKAERERIAELERQRIAAEKAKQDKEDASYQSPTAARVRELTLQTEKDTIQSDLLQSEIEKAEAAKDYAKVLELQNELLSHQETSLTNLKTSQVELSKEADIVRASTKYDTTKWFLPNGETNTYYDDLFNSLGKTGQEAITAIKDKLQLLGNGWRTQEELILIVKESIDETKKSSDSLFKSMLKNIKETRDAQLESIETAELKIQEIIKKGIEMRKDALDQELDDYKKMIDGKIEQKEREWAIEDNRKKSEEDIKTITELQKKIDSVSRDTSLTGIAERKRLEKELAEEMSRIEDDRIQSRRDKERQALENSLTFKEDTTEKAIKAIDKEWDNERITLEAANALRDKSFEEIAKYFPELFNALGVASNDFLGVFETFSTKFDDNVTSMRTGIKKLLEDINAASEALKNIMLDEARLAMGDVSYLTGDQKLIQQDLDKQEIRDLQLEWNNLNDLKQSGLPYDKTRMDKIGDEAQTIRNRWEWEHSKDNPMDLRDYEGTFSQGINAGTVTKTGSYLLHGSASNPEYVFTNSQMFNLIKNLANRTFGGIGGSPQLAGAGMGGMNLSIIVNGNADNGTIAGIKTAGKDILREITENFKKRSF